MILEGILKGILEGILEGAYFSCYDYQYFILNEYQIDLSTIMQHFLKHISIFLAFLALILYQGEKVTI